VPKTDSALIKWTDHAPLVQPHNMSLDLPHLDGAMPKDLLSITQVRTLALWFSLEGMKEGVACYPFIDAGQVSNRGFLCREPQKIGWGMATILGDSRIVFKSDELSGI